MVAAAAARARRSVRPRAALRWLLAAFYLTAGYFHLVRPRPFLAIMPGWVPWPEAVVLWTGIAELAGATALLQPWSRPLRQAAGVGLALYAVCVFPANVNHLLLDMAKPSPEFGWGYHLPRMVAQPLLVWLALWVGEAIDWPFRARRR